MLEFIKKLQEIYPLSTDSVDILLENMEQVSLPKGQLLVEAGRVENYTYIILKGFARGFFYKEEKDVTIWFASVGMTLLSMNAYLYNAPGYENIELLEDCELLRIDNIRLNRLFEENIGLANWGRRMSDVIILKLEKILMERNFLPAAQRYHLLVENEPEILRKSTFATYRFLSGNFPGFFEQDTCRRPVVFYICKVITRFIFRPLSGETNMGYYSLFSL